MEEVKTLGKQYFLIKEIIETSDIEKIRQEILSSTKSDLEVINSARLGTNDYDFNS
jgi:hypothetical protein